MGTPLGTSATPSATDLSETKQDDLGKSTDNTRPPSTAESPRPEDPEKSQLDIEKAAAAATPSPVAAAKEEQQPPAGEASPRKYTTWQWTLVVFALYSSAFIYGLDTTIVADIQVAAVETFGDVQKLGWLGIGFPLGSIATILSIAKAFGIFDVKWLYLTGLVMFEAGSALCGGSPTMDALIVGRVWAGAGGAAVYLGALNIIAINTTYAERALYVSGLGCIWGTGCILGPVIGGSFADSSATWRWAFYINLVLFGVFSPVFFFVIDRFNPLPEVTFVQKLKRLDWVGMILIAAVYTTFVMVFTFGGATWAWDDGRTIALFVVFGVLLIAFIVTQYFSVLTEPDYRVFPGDFLKDRTLVLLYIAQSCAGTSLVIPIYYIPLFFQFTRGDNGVDAAVRLLPFIVLLIATIMFNGAMMPKWGYYAPWFLAAGLLTTLGSALFYPLVDHNTSNATIYGLSIILAVGAGAAQQASYSVAPAHKARTAPHRVADTIGFINSAQIGSTLIALTITSTVFQNNGFHNVKAALAGTGISDDLVHAALAGVRSNVFDGVSAEAQQAVVNGIVSAINDAYILIIAAGALCTIVACFMKWERLFMESGGGA